MVRSDTARKRSVRRETFQGLWPWPGNIFLVLFGAWAAYMGYIAEADDIQTAFYGLTGVTALVLLLGLRTIGRTPVAAPERPARPGQRTEEVSFSPTGANRLPQPVSHRAETGGPARTTPPFPENRPFGPSVDALINREKAARGAQIAKLEHALNERIGLLEAQLGEAPAGTPSATPPALDQYLRIETFNAAINERLLPRIKEMITAALDERMKDGGTDGTPALAGEVAALKTANETARREMADLRKALSAEPGSGGGKGGPATAALAQRLEALEKAEGARRSELSELTGAVSASVAEMGRHLQKVDDFAARVSGALDGAGSAAAEDGDRTPADVAELRNALAMIIEQNREIKARQDLLSQRFEIPVPGDTKPAATPAAPKPAKS
ncbi:hypothetical protein [Acuticoccus yangtzensis]|uniref:hypothetical protein n=1 Tax=Acuticoccus yangtzensis TaxID=1443441 RepID=UPI000949A59B|nr:hypothetical protein [Acuticoccus yangtzensis]